MHYHLEIIMPPTDDVEKSVAEVLSPFDENKEDEEGNHNQHAFWDWYVIGGRWSGEKLVSPYRGKALDEFFEELEELGITASGLVCGKQEIKPKEQIPVVDALWCKYFPGSDAKVCPLFKHYNDQYANSAGSPDIMTLRDCPKLLQAEHVIIACPDILSKDNIRAEYMALCSIWNGVIFQDTAWDGLVSSAIAGHMKRIENYTDEAKSLYTPKDDWLVVTVDYHN